MSENRKTDKISGTEKPKMAERLCKSLDIPPDVFPFGTLVELRGRSSVTLRGCGRITDYTDTEIGFCIKDGELRISGKRLICSCYLQGSATVEGLIDSICFEEDRK